MVKRLNIGFFMLQEVFLWEFPLCKFYPCFCKRKEFNNFLVNRNNAVIENEHESYMVVNAFKNLFLEKNIYE